MDPQNRVPNADLLRGPPVKDIGEGSLRGVVRQGPFRRQCGPEKEGRKEGRTEGLCEHPDPAQAWLGAAPAVGSPHKPGGFRAQQWRL